MSALIACLVPLILAAFLIWMEKLEKMVLHTDQPAPDVVDELPTTSAE